MGIARVNKDGDNPREVLSDPPNIRTNPVKKGASIDKVLFSAPGYNAVGDKYQPANFSLIRKEDRQTQITNGNEKPFKPAEKTKQRPYIASYEHMTDYLEKQKNFRSEENPREVITMPPNIKTNPIKRGVVGKQVHFGGTIPYMEDEYDRPKLFAAVEREYHESKLQEKPFSQRAKKTHTFNSDRKILEENPPIPHRTVKPRTAPTCEHDRPFKPTNPPKKGNHATLAKFPKYQEDPKKPLERKMPVEGEEDKPKFKNMHIMRSRPTPSVATNMRNMKASFPSVFKR